MKAVLLRSKNISATEFYYNVIASALKKKYELIYDGFEEKELPTQKDVLVVCGSCTDMLQLWTKGYRKIVTWYQGTLPEESYMRNQSGIRKAVLSCIERFALKHSVLNIVVSKAMIKHYKRVYGIELNNAYVMPCYNVEFQRKCITEKNPESRVFVYAGGLSKWQCIEQMLQFYKQIEDSVEGKAKLLFLTPEIESAKELVKKYKILNCEVSCVHYSKLAEKMKQAKFGFALREDTVVNQVSTPTKLANYVASGIIPIYSECIRDFYEESKKNPYQVAIHDVNKISNSEIEKIIGLLEKTIESEELQKSMHTYFEQYYNTEWHIQHLSEMLGNAI